MGFGTLPAPDSKYLELRPVRCKKVLRIPRGGGCAAGRLGDDHISRGVKGSRPIFGGAKSRLAGNIAIGSGRIVVIRKLTPRQPACRVNLQPDLLKLAIMGANPVSTAGSYETGVASAA